MRLSEEQQDFARDIAKLITYINTYDSNRYSCTFGDAYRSPRAHGAMGEQGPYGRAKSAHKQRLAVDLLLFKDGIWQTDTEDYIPFGEYWKSLHPDNRWGGDFDFDGDGHGDDGNHFSRWHGGIA